MANAACIRYCMPQSRFLLVAFQRSDFIMSRYLLLLISFLLLCLSGCSAITDAKNDLSEKIFGRELADPPEPLEDIVPTIFAKQMWSAKLGESEDYDFSPATQSNFVYAAGSSGDIAKFDANKGTQVWRIQAGETLSAGVGIGPNLILVGTPKGQVLAYDDTGKLVWKARVSSEVLSVPRYDRNTVVVRCGDSRIYGINATDGARKWIYERNMPSLTLRSSAGVLLDAGAVYAGFAGGKLVALRIDDGKLIWESSIALAKGATEIERIADITSLPVVDGPLIYAVAYQGRTAAIDRVSGKNLWYRDIDSYTGLSVDLGRVYVSASQGNAYSLEDSTGKTFWRQTALKNRRLSAPLPMESVIAYGDVEGNVHFLTREEGVFAARLRLDDSPVMPQMTLLGSNGLLVQTRSGGLYALSVKEFAGKEAVGK